MKRKKVAQSEENVSRSFWCWGVPGRVSVKSFASCVIFPKRRSDTWMWMRKMKERGRFRVNVICVRSSSPKIWAFRILCRCLRTQETASFLVLLCPCFLCLWLIWRGGMGKDLGTSVYEVPRWCLFYSGRRYQYSICQTTIYMNCDLLIYQLIIKLDQVQDLYLARG